jgi:hypothetical protein
MLSILDFSNEDIQTKIRYGLEVQKIVCNIKIDADYTEYMASGGPDRFISNMSTSLGIETKYIDVT